MKNTTLYRNVFLKNKTSQYIDVEELTQREINREDYFLDPMNQVVHMALYCDEFRKEPMKLANKLFLPKKRFSRPLFSFLIEAY